MFKMYEVNRLTEYSFSLRVLQSTNHARPMCQELLKITSVLEDIFFDKLIQGSIPGNTVPELARTSIAIMSEMLSYTESKKFVKEELKMENLESIYLTDRYGLLSEITRRLPIHSPFHNFFVMAQDPGERQKPSWEEIKSRMLTGAGGLCYAKNMFLFYLLRALGFRVILVMAKILIPSQRGSKHVAVLVQDVKQPGDKYVVDVGMFWPSLEPADMSFEKESPEFTQSHFRIKYIKEDEKVIRLQFNINEKIHTYTRFYELSLESWDPSEVGQYMDTIYQTTGQQRFVIHEVLCCVQYDDKGNVRLLQDNVFKRDAEYNNFEKLSLDGVDALIVCILDNFPKLSRNIVTKAVANWKKLCP